MRWIVAVALAVVVPLSGVGVSGEDETARQQQTVDDMLLIGTCMESYAVDHAAYPEGSSLEEIRGQLVPAYARELPNVDGWGRSFVIQAGETSYELRSLAADGRRDSGEPAGAADDPDLDIVYSNGRFVQWPAALGS